MPRVARGPRNGTNEGIARPGVGALRRCCLAGIALGAFLALFLLAARAGTAAAEPQASPFQDCLSCHQKTLEYHDRLGSGNASCAACHDSNDMKKLRLADGTSLPLSESPQLCGQCHQKRYDAWLEGTHGVPGTVAAAKCSSCHNPHKPQVALTGITKPHPADTPPPPSPPFDLVMIVTISLVFTVGAGILVGRGAL